MKSVKEKAESRPPAVQDSQVSHLGWLVLLATGPRVTRPGGAILFVTALGLLPELCMAVAQVVLGPPLVGLSTAMSASAIFTSFAMQ